MTRSEIQKIMDKVSGLNDFGIGTFNPGKRTSEEREKDFAEGKDKLLESVDACTKCCEWLDKLEKVNAINSRQNSYGLKHVAEVDIGYLTNGVFITAAIHCGFKYRVIPGSPNVEFNVSEKSIKAVKRRQNNEGKGNWAV